MTQRVSRSVDSAVLTEAANTHVEPFKLVRIEFPVVGNKFFSEGQTVEFPDPTTSTVTSSDAGTILTDTTATFITDGTVEAGQVITNQTTGATAVLLSVDSETQLTHSQLSSGTWTSGNAYKVSGNTYQTASVGVGGFQWYKDGRQTGKIRLYNSENNDAIAIVLGDRLARNPIKIYQTYKLTPTTNTPPVLIVSGECSGSVIDPDSGIITISIVSEGVDSKQVPNRYFSPAEGFNHIPPVGRSITFGNEIFVFERAR